MKIDHHFPFQSFKIRKKLWTYGMLGLLALLSIFMLPERLAYALARPENLHIATLNIQGSTGKWSTSILPLAQNDDIVALQEVGDVASNAILVNVNVRGTGVSEYTWSVGRLGALSNRFIYMLPNPNAQGNNSYKNLVFITTERPDEIFVIPAQAGARRGALGIRFGTTWYFTLHAISGASLPRSDVVATMEAIQAHAGNRTWILLGDFNQEPTALAQYLVPRFAHPFEIYNPGQATQRSGGELDYMISSRVLRAMQAQVLNGGSSDHFPVLFAALQGNAEAYDGHNYNLTDSDNHLMMSSLPDLFTTIEAKNATDLFQRWKARVRLHFPLRFGLQNNKTLSCAAALYDNSWGTTLIKEVPCTNVPEQTFYFGPDHLLYNQSTLKPVGIFPGNSATLPPGGGASPALNATQSPGSGASPGPTPTPSPGSGGSPDPTPTPSPGSGGSPDPTPLLESGPGEITAHWIMTSV